WRSRSPRSSPRSWTSSCAARSRRTRKSPPFSSPPKTRKAELPGRIRGSQAPPNADGAAQMVGKLRLRGALGPAPAAEDQSAERKAEPEGPEREPADRERLAYRGQAFPAAECLLLLVGERLAAAPLAPCGARAQAQ